MEFSKETTKLAQDAYAAFRGAFRGEYAPCHWDDLGERQKQSFCCVAQWGFDAGKATLTAPERRD